MGISVIQGWVAQMYCRPVHMQTGGQGVGIHACLCEHGVAYIGAHNSVNNCIFMQVEETSFCV